MKKTYQSMMKRRHFNRLSLFFFGYILASCTGGKPQTSKSTNKDNSDSLQIWWQEGFYPEETDALDDIIASWEQKSAQKVKLTTISQKDMLKEIESAIAADKLPDICYTGVGDLAIFPQLAWNDQLVEVDDVIAPLKDKYDPNVLTGVNYQNNVLGERRYYAVPIMQSAIHIHYWQDMLTAVGVSREDIPGDWDGFWLFWEEMQERLHQGEQPDIYSVGMPMSLSLDTYNNFEQFLEAYDVEILDKDGRLQIDKAEVRQGIALALTQYTRFYKNGKVPPESLDWDNTGNNAALLSRSSLMTVNHTLSAPGSQRQEEDTYYNQLSTRQWPNKVSGKPMRYVVELKQVVLFKSSNKQDIAKDFLSYLAQPQNLQKYAEGSQARYLPVMPELFEKPFWQDPKDFHIKVALQQLQNTRPAYQVFNPAYGEVAAQNIWGSIIRKIGLGALTIEEATEQAVAQIKKIFSDWQ